MSNIIQGFAWQLPMPGYASDKSVLAKLADNANDEGVCHPAWKRIEREASVSTANLSEILNAFECYGIVERTHRKRRNGANSSNSYKINIPEFSRNDIAEYWETKEGVVAEYVNGYVCIRKALTMAKKGKSVALFIATYAKAKEANQNDLFVNKWLEIGSSIKGKKFSSEKEKSESLKVLFESAFITHTSSGEVAHTSSGEVAHTSSGEVAHTSSGEVATIEPSYSFNHHIINNTNESFSFNLKKQTQFDNLSAEYKAELKKYADEKNGSKYFEAFENHHGAKGSLFKDWSRAYNTWSANAAKWEKGNSNKSQDAKSIIVPAQDLKKAGNW